MTLELGGVYSLVLREYDKRIAVSESEMRKNIPNDRILP